MNITAIGMVRDEADIIRETISNLTAQGVDRILIADNDSTDNTRALLETTLLGEVTVVDDPEPGYYQDTKMTALARQAHAEGADWVLPFDADELWYSPDGRTVRDVLQGADHDVIAALEYKHWPTPWDEPGDPNAYTRLTYRETVPHRLHKVCFRATPTAALHMGNHGVNLDGRYDPDRPDRAVALLELRHFPYRSFSQFVRKVRNGRHSYQAATDRTVGSIAAHPMSGTHWREMGAMTDQELAALWADCTAGTALSHVWMGHGDLTRDPAPW